MSPQTNQPPSFPAENPHNTQTTTDSHGVDAAPLNFKWPALPVRFVLTVCAFGAVALVRCRVEEGGWGSSALACTCRISNSSVNSARP